MLNESLAMEKTEYLMPKINDSMSDLRTCFEILEQVEPVSVVDKVSRRVHKAMVDAAMAFDLLQRRENIKYRLQFLISYLIPDMQIGYLTTILMSLPQYLILVLGLSSQIVNLTVCFCLLWIIKISVFFSSFVTG